MIANWKSSNVQRHEFSFLSVPHQKIGFSSGFTSRVWIFLSFRVRRLNFLLVLRQESGVLLVSRQRLDYLLVSRQEKRFSSCFASGYWIFLWTCVKSLDFLLVSCQEKEFSSCFCIRKLNFPIFFPFLNTSYSIKQNSG